MKLETSSDSNSGSGLPIPIIAGAGGGAVLFIIVLFCVVFLCYKRRSQKKKVSYSIPTIYSSHVDAPSAYSEGL